MEDKEFKAFDPETFAYIKDVSKAKTLLTWQLKGMQSQPGKGRKKKKKK